ncbi:MAG: ankyrin repeat domain-containing protein [Candidatus Babeliaceae bacterium]
MKNSIALYALVCGFVLPVYGMKDDCAQIDVRDYFVQVPDEIISEVVYQSINVVDRVIDRTALMNDFRSFSLTCKRFNEIGEAEFIHQTCEKTNAHGLSNNKAHIAASFNAVRWLENFFNDTDNMHLIDAKNSESKTPLYYAVIYNAYGAASLLLDLGANVHAEDKNKVQALHYAICVNNPLMVKLLLDKGADINSNQWAAGVLSYAKQRGNAQIIHLLEQAIAIAKETKE